MNTVSSTHFSLLILLYSYRSSNTTPINVNCVSLGANPGGPVPLFIISLTFKLKRLHAYTFWGQYAY